MNYKSLLLLTILPFAVISRSNAQEKVKKFCTLSYSSTYLSSIEGDATVDYGQTKKYSPLKDSIFVEKLKKVQGIYNFVQAMNYMTELGWKYEGNISLGNSNGTNTKILFSKEFYKTELNEPKYEH